MIDIHTHFLWGVDDGAETADASLAMLRLAAASGTTHIVATPHADDSYTFDPGLVSTRLADLSRMAPPGLVLYAGCDFHLSFENIQDAFADPRKYTINRGPYLLVEFSDLVIPPNIDRVFATFLARGVVPIVTHPERNPVLQQRTDLLRTWAGQGCLIQITAQSLTDRFGKRAQETCRRLLRSGMVHFIASDAHDTEHRPPRLDIARETITREFGAELAGLLLEENPYSVITGCAILPGPAPAPTPRKWFHLWRRPGPGAR